VDACHTVPGCMTTPYAAGAAEASAAWQKQQEIKATADDARDRVDNATKMIREYLTSKWSKEKTEELMEELDRLRSLLKEKTEELDRLLKADRLHLDMDEVHLAEFGVWFSTLKGLQRQTRGDARHRQLQKGRSRAAVAVGKVPWHHHHPGHHHRHR
jgi:hypothetical protein